jgi:hypothetical protein
MFGDSRYIPSLVDVMSTEDYKRGNIVSSSSFVDLVNGLGNDITAAEVGIAFGLNIIYMIEHCPNIKKYYGVDPHLEYQDWSPDCQHGHMTQDLMSMVGKKFLENLNDYQQKNKIEYINKSSDDAKDLIPDNSLDFMFIDANHSTESVKQDCLNYYGKMKKGAIFSGHDYDANTVQAGVRQFMDIVGIPAEELKVVYHDRTPPCWMIIIK